jgi:hypothetical protein
MFTRFLIASPWRYNERKLYQNRWLCMGKSNAAYLLILTIMTKKRIGLSWKELNHVSTQTLLAFLLPLCMYNIVGYLHPWILIQNYVILSYLAVNSPISFCGIQFKKIDFHSPFQMGIIEQLYLANCMTNNRDKPGKKKTVEVDRLLVQLRSITSTTNNDCGRRW